MIETRKIYGSLSGPLLSHTRDVGTSKEVLMTVDELNLILKLVWRAGLVQPRQSEV